MKFMSSLLTVKDIGKSKDFYVGILGRKVTADHGENVEFDSGFSLHQRAHYAGLLDRRVARGKFDVELYFEDEELSELEVRLRAAGVDFVHGAEEQPWRQRCMRFLDPDGYVIEVGEPMAAVVRRLERRGLSRVEIAEATGLGAAFVDEALTASIAWAAPAYKAEAGEGEGAHRSLQELPALRYAF